MTAPAFFLATLGLSALSFGKGESCHPHFCRLGHLLPSFLEVLPPTTFTIQALPPSFLYVQPPATFANLTPMHLRKSNPHAPHFGRSSHPPPSQTSSSVPLRPFCAHASPLELLSKASPSCPESACPAPSQQVGSFGLSPSYVGVRTSWCVSR